MSQALCQVLEMKKKKKMNKILFFKSLQSAINDNLLNA